MLDEPRSRKSLSDHRLSAISHKGETLINLTTGNSDGFKSKKARKSINKSWVENTHKTFESEGYKS